MTRELSGLALIGSSCRVLGTPGEFVSIFASGSACFLTVFFGSDLARALDQAWHVYGHHHMYAACVFHGMLDNTVLLVGNCTVVPVWL